MGVKGLKKIWTQTGGFTKQKNEGRHQNGDSAY